MYELRAAGQRAMGSDVVLPTGAAKRADLHQQLNGLQVLLTEAQEFEKVAKESIRRAAHALVRACAERCAEDYVQAAQNLGWCWTQLAAESAMGATTDMFLTDLGYAPLSIPGSQSLEILKWQTQMEWGKPVILSGDRLARRLEGTRGEIKSHAEEVVETWPL